MSYFSVAVPDKEPTIIGPIVNQLLNDIKNKWFYDPDIELVYYDHTGTSATIGARTNTNPNDIRLNTSKRIEARLITKLIDDNVFANNPNAFSGPDTWDDPKIPAKLRLSRATTRFSLVLKYTASSRANVNNWLALYHSRVGMGIGQLSFSASYEVMVPDIIPVLLKTIHTQYDSVANTGEDFRAYLDRGFKVPYNIQQIAGKDNSKQLVLTERIHNLGVMIPSESPEVSIVEGGAWETELTLEFDINVPSMFLLQYSEFVAGNWLPEWCYDTKLNRNAVQRRGYSNGAHADIVMGYLLDQAQMPLYRANAFIYPAFDTATVSTAGLAMNPVLQVRLVVDPDNLRHVVDLATLASDIDVTLHPDIVPYLIAAGKSALISAKGLFTVSVARDGLILTPNYTIDSSGVMTSTYDMDPLGNYHLLISVTNDFPSLAKDESDLAFEFGDLFNAAVIYNYPAIDPTLLPVVGEEDDTISLPDALELGKHIRTKYRSPNANMFTCSTLIVETQLK